MAHISPVESIVYISTTPHEVLDLSLVGLGLSRVQASVVYDWKPRAHRGPLKVDIGFFWQSGIVPTKP